MEVKSKFRAFLGYVVLCFITVGIYHLYWIYKNQNDINVILNDNKTSGGKVILLSIITCGIYLIYWQYKMGTRIDSLRTQNGKKSNNTGVLYLLLGVLNLSILTNFLVILQINEYCRSAR